MNNWTHPTHARGVKSPTLASAHIGKPLTDSDIARYELLGFYGAERQAAARARQIKKASKTKHQTNKKDNLALALAVLHIE